jgi:hypothetical protein
MALDSGNQIDVPFALPIKIEDPEIAVALANLTVVWGSLERVIFRLLEAIDFKKTNEFVAKFYAGNYAGRISTAKPLITEAGEVIGPDYVDRVRVTFDKFDQIRWRRNPLVHGIWRKTANGFDVLPLKLSKSKLEFEPAIAVNIETLRTLYADIEALLNDFGDLTIQMLFDQERRDAEREERRARGFE